MIQLSLEKLTKNYVVGDELIPGVIDINLQVAKGDFVSIVGHSGSGKTTLLSILGGILSPTSGQVLFKGQNICEFNDLQLSEYRNNNIGFMFQFASLLPILTATENILLADLFANSRQEQAEKKAHGLLDLVGIAAKINSYPAQLSGGQQRRVAIARALMNDPDIILADEPTGDLDEETEAEIFELFRKINQEKKVTIILITHNTELAAQGKDMYSLKNNRLEFVG